MISLLPVLIGDYFHCLRWRNSVGLHPRADPVVGLRWL